MLELFGRELVGFRGGEGMGEERIREERTSMAQLTKIEHARKPIIVITRKMNIFLDAHDAGVRKRSLYSTSS